MRRTTNVPQYDTDSIYWYIGLRVERQIYIIIFLQTSEISIGPRLVDAIISDVFGLVAASAFYSLWTMEDFFFNDYDYNTHTPSPEFSRNSLMCVVCTNSFITFTCA